MRALIKSLFLFSLFFFCSLPTLFAKIINVPRDFSAIKSALTASHKGDTIEVEDGFYFEENIIIDKNIRLKAKNLYGAVIYGSQPKGTSSSIFIVRAETEIERFILKNGNTGIMQRDSPDVRWTAHDLAILNMEDCAVVVNDRERNVGRASLYNIIVDKANIAFTTNTNALSKVSLRGTR